ncbi:FUN14 domain-containing protein [Natrialbaceae archaeon GCM10025810]|uniref:FUN14 domain-containing protein n=1 Tax=Halovalidus salilacus TaxID=3075124 RepID=UPI00360C1DE9
MVNIDPTVLGLEVGASAAVGAILGFAAKQVAKFVAIVVGVQLVVVRYLESQGILAIDWNALSAGLIDTRERAREVDVTVLESALSTLSVGAGFTAGFLLGFYRG